MGPEGMGLWGPWVPQTSSSRDLVKDSRRPWGPEALDGLQGKAWAVERPVKPLRILMGPGRPVEEGARVGIQKRKKALKKTK